MSPSLCAAPEQGTVPSCPQGLVGGCRIHRSVMPCGQRFEMPNNGRAPTIACMYTCPYTKSILAAACLLVTSSVPAIPSPSTAFSLVLRLFWTVACAALVQHDEHTAAPSPPSLFFAPFAAPLAGAPAGHAAALRSAELLKQDPLPATAATSCVPACPSLPATEQPQWMLALARAALRPWRKPSPSAWGS